MNVKLGKLAITLLTLTVMVTSSLGVAFAKDSEIEDNIENKIEDVSETQSKVTIMLTGDLMCQYNQQYAAYDGRGGYDFTPTFKYVKEIFKDADFVVGNLETLVSTTLPLSKDMYKLNNHPYLNAPSEYLAALKDAGFSGLVMANNHNCDGGITGIKETLESVDEYGFKHTGLFSSSKDDRYFIFEKDGIKIGFLAYAGFFNDNEAYYSKNDRKLYLNQLNEIQVERDVKALREAGADYIIAYNHSGDEYVAEPSSREVIFAILLANAGVDFVINSHPHVLQRSEVITTKDGRKVPVVYSMGNFTSHMNLRQARESIILSLEITKSPEGQAELSNRTYYPLYNMRTFNGESFVLIPESADYANSPYSLEAKKAFKHIKSLFHLN